MVTLGILVAYIVDWGFAALEQLALDVRRSAVVPGAALAIGMYFMPFSPRWLVEQGPRGRRAGRARALPRRRGRVDGEIDGDQGGRREGVQPARARGKAVRRDDDRRRRAGDLPADRRHQHRHLLRADDPQVRRPAGHRRADPERLHRLHERRLHDRRDPAARPARAALLPDRRDLDADRRAGRRSASSSSRRRCSTAPAGSRSSACSSTSRASRSGSARCSG